MCNFQRWRRALAASSSSAQAAALADDIVGLYKALRLFYSRNAGLQQSGNHGRGARARWWTWFETTDGGLIGYSGLERCSVATTARVEL